MYYGNGSVTSKSNGTATFDFFNDFEGTGLDSNKWDSDGFAGYSTFSGYYDIEDGLLKTWGDDLNWRLLRAIVNITPSDRVSIITKTKRAGASYVLYGLTNANEIDTQRVGLLDAGADTDWDYQRMVDGAYIWNCKATDTNGNSAFAPANYTLRIDATNPSLNWQSPDDNSYNTQQTTEINLTITEPNLDNFKFRWWNGISWINSTFYSNSLVLALNFNKNSNIGECYDEATQILTNQGWKYFWELDGTELIYTLNPFTLKPIFQKPTARQEYDYQGEMYKITLEDGTMLYVSPEHKVYVE
jgi:hypothetical protein